jgi:hypothetical protein
MEWEDLIKPGVEVVLANPKTAGVARWIFLALWGSQVRRVGTLSPCRAPSKEHDNAEEQCCSLGAIE